MDHDPISNDTGDTIAQHPGWDEMQNGFLTVYQQCVARIVTTLKAYDSGGTISQQINDLAFTFITPLSANNDDALSH